jgi:signal peptidase II
MRLIKAMLRTPNRRISVIALVVAALDQCAKLLMVHLLPSLNDERVVIDGFFKFVHWANTGAAWSILRGANGWLALVAFATLVVLFFSRHYFDSRTPLSQIAFGLIAGGIAGNLIDRFRVQHVIDFSLSILSCFCSAYAELTMALEPCSWLHLKNL